MYVILMFLYVQSNFLELLHQSKLGMSFRIKTFSVVVQLKRVILLTICDNCSCIISLICRYFGFVGHVLIVVVHVYMLNLMAQLESFLCMFLWL